MAREGGDLHHTVVVVDPDATTAERVRCISPSLGADDIRSVATAREALALLRVGPRTRRTRVVPWLLVVELDLADMSGLGLCRRLRLVRSLREVPILATSSLCDGEVIEAAFEAGANDFVPRPLDAHELSARLHAMLRRARAGSRRRRREQELVELVRQLEAKSEALRRQVCVDGLTGIVNRHHFERVASAEWQRAARDGAPLSVVMLDVDHFHAFNAAHGHPEGDACLRQIAAALASSLRRPSDLLARYGGEEFIAILADTDAVGAAVVAERMRGAVERLALRHGGDGAGPVVTVSAGLATAVPRIACSVEDLIASADAALLEAKAQGRNRVSGVPADAPATRDVTPPYPWPRPVVVDPSLAGELPAILRARRAVISDVHSAAATGELGPVRTATRELRVLASTYGLTALEPLTRRLEHAARRTDHDLVLQTIDEVAWYLDRVHVVYRRDQGGSVH